MGRFHHGESGESRAAEFFFKYWCNGLFQSLFNKNFFDHVSAPLDDDFDVGTFALRDTINSSLRLIANTLESLRCRGVNNLQFLTSILSHRHWRAPNSTNSTKLYKSVEDSVRILFRAWRFLYDAELSCGTCAGQIVFSATSFKNLLASNIFPLIMRKSEAILDGRRLVRRNSTCHMFGIERSNVVVVCLI